MTSKFAAVLARTRKQTPQQTIQTLIKIGVLTETGELTPHYQQKPTKAKRKAPKP